MNSTQHAVVEVSAEQITLRVGGRWLRFTAAKMEYNNKASLAFALTEDGNVTIDGGVKEEMDLAAERLAREMMQEPL